MARAEAREVIDHAGIAQMRTHRRQIAEIGLDQRHRARRAFVEVLALPVDQVVDDDDPLTLQSELTHEFGSDEPGASGDNDRGSTRIHRSLRNLAGTPAMMEDGLTSSVTTAPAPTIAPRPTVTPGRMTALTPMSAPAPMRTGLISRSV